MNNNSASIKYTGVDNLASMEQAEKYNCYLLSLIRSCYLSTDTVTDFGAGTGTLARALRSASPDVQLTCVELDNHLQQQLQQEGFPVVSSLNQLDDSSVDLLYSFNVLEHIEADDHIAREIFRVLKPGGRVLIYVPAFNLLFSSMDKKVGHLRRYTRRSLSRLLHHAGLRISRCQYVDSLGFFATLIYKLIGSRDGSLHSTSLCLYDRYVFPLSRLLDRLLFKLLGKNAFALAIKPYDVT